VIVDLLKIAGFIALSGWATAFGQATVKPTNTAPVQLGSE
jgi:hypothetical protein